MTLADPPAGGEQADWETMAWPGLITNPPACGDVSLEAVVVTGQVGLTLLMMIQTGGETM